MFFICLTKQDRVFGYYAINFKSILEELANISITQTISKFAFIINPKVVMSSYSIDSSYTCQIVDKVRDDI
jgi:phosphotransacetylase